MCIRLGLGSVWAFQIETGTLRRLRNEDALVMYAVIKNTSQRHSHCSLYAEGDCYKQ